MHFSSVLSRSKSIAGNSFENWLVEPCQKCQVLHKTCQQEIEFQNETLIQVRTMFYQGGSL